MSEPATPAATLIVMREGVGPPELLVVERAAMMRFAAGATVFPGGRVDPADLAQASGDPDGAGRIAAVRETLEETGLAIALGPRLSPTLATELRAALHAGAAFGSLLATHGVHVDTDALVPFARWRPRHLEHRAFDTRFYLARAPEGLPPPLHDGAEVISTNWTPAADLLAAAGRGEARLIYPTRRTLERLARFATFDDAAADAAAHPIETITPWIEERDGVPQLCIPKGLGYPVTAEPLDQVRRG